MPFGKCGYVCARFENAKGECVNSFCPLKQRGLQRQRDKDENIQNDNNEKAR
jgi:hypothetical protein